MKKLKLNGIAAAIRTSKSSAGSFFQKSFVLKTEITAFILYFIVAYEKWHSMFSNSNLGYGSFIDLLYILWGVIVFWFGIRPRFMEVFSRHCSDDDELEYNLSKLLKDKSVQIIDVLYSNPSERMRNFIKDLIKDLNLNQVVSFSLVSRHVNDFKIENIENNSQIKIGNLGDNFYLKPLVKGTELDTPSFWINGNKYITLRLGDRHRDPKEICEYDRTHPVTGQMLSLLRILKTSQDESEKLLSYFGHFLVTVNDRPSQPHEEPSRSQYSLAYIGISQETGRQNSLTYPLTYQGGGLLEDKLKFCWRSTKASINSFKRSMIFYTAGDDITILGSGDRPSVNFGYIKFQHMPGPDGKTYINSTREGHFVDMGKEPQAIKNADISFNRVVLNSGEKTVFENFIGNPRLIDYQDPMKELIIEQRKKYVTGGLV